MKTSSKMRSVFRGLAIVSAVTVLSCQVVRKQRQADEARRVSSKPSEAVAEGKGSQPRPIGSSKWDLVVDGRDVRRSPAVTFGKPPQTFAPGSKSAPLVELEAMEKALKQKENANPQSTGPAPPVAQGKATP